MKPPLTHLIVILTVGLISGRHTLPHVSGGDVILPIERRLAIAWRGQPAPIGTPEGTHHTLVLTSPPGGGLVNLPIETVPRSAW